MAANGQGADGCGHHHAGDHDHADHGGHHGHHHGAIPQNFDRAFAIGTALNLLIVVAEAVGGVLANSVALLADAGHNLSDVLGLLLAWGAVWLTRRRPTLRRTYGFGRSSILAALINAVVLLLAVGAISWEAVVRLFNPEPVGGLLIAVIAVIGAAVNGLVAWLLRGGQEDLNRRGAFLHMVADAAVSVGVAIGAAVIAVTGWQWLDPLVSLGINAVIVIGTWSLLRQSFDLAMDAVPETVDRAAVEAFLAGLPGVSEVHDLHIWGLSTTQTAMTVHLVRPGIGSDDALLARIADELRDRFKIDHPTIQIEHGDGAFGCRLAPADVI